MTKRNGQIRFTEKTRTRPPKLEKDKEGKVTGLLCPFCQEPHPIFVDRISQCGAKVEVKAIQSVFHGASVTCARCGLAGGTFTKMGENLYVHSTPCLPTNFYTETPKLSKSAAVAYRLPDKMLVSLVKLIGVQPERLVKLENGKPTDKVVGYTWKKVNHAKSE